MDFKVPKTTTVKQYDVDGDGLPDIIAPQTDETVKVWLNPPESPYDFSAVEPIYMNVPETGELTDVVVDDVDKDGTPDMVLVSKTKKNVIVFAPTFDQASKTYTSASSVSFGAEDEQTLTVVVEDVDGDGFPDILIGNYEAPNYVFFNQRDGSDSFSESTLIGSSTDDKTTALTVADLDGDGKMDIVVANFDTDNHVFKGTDDMRTSLPTIAPTTVGMPEDDWQYTRIAADWQYALLSTNDLAVADFTGDGVPDIVTAQDGAPNFLFKGDGTGDFSQVTPTKIEIEPPSWYESDYEGSERQTWGQYKGEVDDSVSITPADVDGDGDLDVVVGNRDTTAKVYFNDGAGVFEYRTVLGEPYVNGPVTVGKTAPDSMGLAVSADLNGDGYPDVVSGTEVLINPGTGDFHNVRSTPYWDTAAQGGATPVLVMGIDIDYDGDNDLVVHASAPSPMGGRTHVLINPGSGLEATEMALNGWWGMPESMLDLDLGSDFVITALVPFDRSKSVV